MIIDNLPVLPKPIQDTDEVPVERGTKTYKDTLGNIIGEYTAGAVSDWLDENIPTGQTVVVDKSLTVDGAAADAKKTGDELSGLKSASQLDEKYALLLHDEIPGTTQTIAFDSSGNVSTITHTNGSNVSVRTDAFTFAANSITEVRTLNTGETLTIVTNTTTLVTTVTYAAAA